ncbi:MAG: hypothetical protein sGL2_08140 [Candidatus Mesenet longicola]|nr:MAG: hypothetical protein sGL2_08140 [Candidatus Mesenet longicola]
MNISNYFKYPNEKLYGLLKYRLGLVIYFAYIANLIIRIASQFNKNGEKQGIIIANISLALLISSISIMISIISLHHLSKDKEYKKDTRKIRIISYSIALISSIATIAQIISLTSIFGISSKEGGSANLNTIFSFAGTLMSIFIFYPIAIYCRNHDRNSSEAQKEKKKHKTILNILFAMLMLDLVAIANKVVGFLEKKGSFIIENATFNLGNDVTYYFNFSVAIGTLYAVIMMGLSTYRMVVEQSSELSDVGTIQEIDPQQNIST